MNNEQILEIAEKHFDKGVISGSLMCRKSDILAFAHELLSSGEAVGEAYLDTYGDAHVDIYTNGKYQKIRDLLASSPNNTVPLFATPRIPEGMKLVPIEPTDESLLKPINSPIRCHCPPDKCNAPVIMGRQTPCLRKSAPTKD